MGILKYLSENYLDTYTPEEKRILLFIQHNINDDDICLLVDNDRVDKDIDSSDFKAIYETKKGKLFAVNEFCRGKDRGSYYASEVVEAPMGSNCKYERIGKPLRFLAIPFDFSKANTYYSGMVYTRLKDMLFKYLDKDDPDFIYDKETDEGFNRALEYFVIDCMDSNLKFIG